MRKTLTFILIYVLASLVGTAIFATLFMFNTDMMLYVTDTNSPLFSLDYFLYGASLAYPLVGVGVMVALVLVMIRNSKNQIPCLIAYIVLGLFTWTVAIPFSLKQAEKQDGLLENIAVKATSAGIFRGDASGVFYYSRILEDGKADGIFIDTTGYLGKDDGFITFYDTPINNASAYPYSDILIKRAVQPSNFVVFPLSIYSSILTSATHYNGMGFLFWLCFASMGLAMLSTYGIQFFSEWKLSSGMFVIFTVLAIAVGNFHFYMDIMPKFIKDFSRVMAENTGVDNAFIVAVNLIVAVVFTLLGIVMSIYRRKKGEVEVVQEAD
ncbi:MAG: hypothetical protein KBT11_02755 [Treponema sp.]|nr:hypothetical protein [Candidatus Treponema equifaecale]